MKTTDLGNSRRGAPAGPWAWATRLGVLGVMTAFFLPGVVVRSCNSVTIVSHADHVAPLLGKVSSDPTLLACFVLGGVPALAVLDPEMAQIAAMLGLLSGAVPALAILLALEVRRRVGGAARWYAHAPVVLLALGALWFWGWKGLVRVGYDAEPTAALAAAGSALVLFLLLVWGAIRRSRGAVRLLAGPMLWELILAAHAVAWYLQVGEGSIYEGQVAALAGALFLVLGAVGAAWLGEPRITPAAPPRPVFGSPAPAATLGGAPC